MSQSQTVLQELEACIRRGIGSLQDQLFVEGVIKDKPELARFADEFGETLLMIAADACNAPVVALLCRLGAEVNKVSDAGLSPLICAVRSELDVGLRLKVVDLLLGCGADPNILGSMGCNSLHWAAMQGDVSLVELMIKYGADVDLRTSDRDTASAEEIVQSGRFQGSESVREKVLLLLRRGQE